MKLSWRSSWRTTTLVLGINLYIAAAGIAYWLWPSAFNGYVKGALVLIMAVALAAVVAQWRHQGALIREAVAESKALNEYMDGKITEDQLPPAIQEDAKMFRARHLLRKRTEW